MKIIKPNSPDQEFGFEECTVFLAGSIDNGMATLWAEEVTQRLADLNITVFNPRRDDWDPTWVALMDNPEFAYQVNWELDAIDTAAIVFFYFEPGSVSPITLQELGYSIGMNLQVVVCCPDGFWRKGNVDAMCRRSNIPLHNDLDSALSALRSAITDPDAHWAASLGNSK